MAIFLKNGVKIELLAHLAYSKLESERVILEIRKIPKSLIDLYTPTIALGLIHHPRPSMSQVEVNGV